MKEGKSAQAAIDAVLDRNPDVDAPIWSLGTTR
jgi:hypothetical protein